MADANPERLQVLARANYGRDLNGALRLATGINLDANGICLALWGKEFNEALVEMTQVLSNRALLLPGTSGAYASTPDAADLDIVGDIDIRVEFAQVVAAVNMVYLSKWTATGNQRSYRVRRSLFATQDIHWSTDGTAELGALTAFPPIVVLNPGAVRLTLDVADTTNRVATLYTSTSLDGPWTQTDQSVTAGNTSIFPSTAPLALGASSVGTDEPFRGRITRAQVRNGIDGTVVANPDFRALAPGTTSFADSTGKTWTIHGGAVV